MKKSYMFKKIALGLILSTTLFSCERNSTFEDQKASITKLVVLNSNFSILETAAIKGGVALLLTNPNQGDVSGKFTVFAPTNAAFERLGLNSDNLATLDQTFLENTLKYAVSNGNLLSGGFTGTSESALSGIKRKFTEKNGQKYINGSKILASDIAAANGTVHAIDKILLATGGNIVESALAVRDKKVFVTSDLNYLVAAVLYADPAVATALTTASSTGLTVFAPSDQAFINLSEALVTAGLLSTKFTQPSDITKLSKGLVTTVLLNNVIGGGKFTSELASGANAAVGGGTLTLGAFENGVLTVKGNANSTVAKMLIPDIQATNGVIHIIDTVLLP